MCVPEYDWHDNCKPTPFTTLLARFRGHERRTERAMSVPDKAGFYPWHCTALPIDNPLPAWLATFGGSRVVVSIIECEGELIAYVPGVQGSVPIERLTTLGEWGPRIPEPSVRKPWLVLACGFMVCPECGACGPDAGPQPEHYDDCRWQLAQESQDASS